MTDKGTGQGAARLLVVDDEPDVRELIVDVGQSVGFEVADAGSFDEFRAVMGQFDPTLIVLDLNMPETDGVEHLRYLAEQQSRATILLISGFDRRVLESARRLGMSQGLNLGEVLHKPVRVAEMRRRLRPYLVATEEDSGDESSGDSPPNLQRTPESSGAGAPRKSDVEIALENREFVLHYQPKVALSPSKTRDTRRALRVGDETWPLAGVEGLVRWRRPNGDLVPPGRFIPEVENNQLMGRLTLLLAHKAFEQMRTWSDDAGFSPVVALNFSAQLLDHLSLPEEIADLARDHGVPPNHVILEITETAAMLDVARCLDITSRLRLKGFALAIDDFGTGYSSLVQLQRMPFSELKIDRAFVSEVTSSEEAKTVVQLMVELAHRLSMTACAEGVEDRPTIDFLRSIDCDLAQGFVFSQPVDPESLVSLTMPLERDN